MRLVYIRLALMLLLPGAVWAEAETPPVRAADVEVLYPAGRVLSGTVTLDGVSLPLPPGEWTVMASLAGPRGTLIKETLADTAQHAHESQRTAQALALFQHDKQRLTRYLLLDRGALLSIQPTEANRLLPQGRIERQIMRSCTTYLNAFSYSLQVSFATSHARCRQTFLDDMPVAKYLTLLRNAEDYLVSRQMALPRRRLVYSILLAQSGQVISAYLAHPADDSALGDWQTCILSTPAQQQLIQQVTAEGDALLGALEQFSPAR